MSVKPLGTCGLGMLSTEESVNKAQSYLLEKSKAFRVEYFEKQEREYAYLRFLSTDLGQNYISEAEKYIQIQEYVRYTNLLKLRRNWEVRFLERRDVLGVIGWRDNLKTFHAMRDLENEIANLKMVKEL